MIETLNGIFETINCKQSTTLKLYDNDECENYPTHWHPAIEIIMPVENWYKFIINGQELLLEEGEILFICPGSTHSIIAPKEGRRIIFQPNSNYLGFMREVAVLFTLMSPYLVINQAEYGEVYHRIKRLLLEIRDIYFKDEAFSEVEIYCKFLEMINLIGKRHTEDASKQTVHKGKKDEYEGKFIEICHYISEHCSENLNLDAIAAMSGFSKYYFERLFKQYTGRSFYKYVNFKRIAKAEQMLVEPNNSITDVALGCGFTSMPSFIRMFKQIKGCTPSEYKSMYWHIDASLAENEKKNKKW